MEKYIKETYRIRLKDLRCVNWSLKKREKTKIIIEEILAKLPSKTKKET